MNSRERVLCALGHREADRIPLDLGAGICCKMHVAFYRRLLEHLGLVEDVRICNRTGQTAFASDAVLELLGCDVRTPFSPFLRAEGGGEEWEDREYFYFRDDWGTGYRMPKSNPLYYDMCDFPLAAAGEKERASHPWPEPGRIDPCGVAQAQAYQAAGYPVTFVDHYANGFLQTGPRLYDFDNWLMMLAGEEDEARRHLDRLLEQKKIHYDRVLSHYGPAVDVVCESDDLGIQTGPFIAPAMFRDLFKPYWRNLFAFIRERSKAKILLHSCGSCVAMLGDLVDAGLDIINPVQISAADMHPLRLKREFGRDLVFWGGGVDTQRVLPKGTPAEVRENVKRNIGALAEGGGFVFATVHNVQADVPVANFMAMWETFMDNRDY